ncbi:hypothetical protein GCK32_006137 [Trichostrongylus colubriformis]|uniref:Uncharacterized protein n=1 Tax=Trichostrongylus colubriformis TaxID=6319 RepID=A0AAN8IJP3_TRICO
MQWFVIACLAVACLVQVQAGWYQRWIYRPDYRTYRTNYLSRSATKYHKCHRSGNGLYCFSSYQLPADCMTSGRDTVVCAQQRHYYGRTPYRRPFYRRRRILIRPLRIKLKPTKQSELKTAKQNKNKENPKVAKSSKGGKSD